MSADSGMQAIDLSGAGQGIEKLVEQVIHCLETECKSLLLASYLPQLMLVAYGLPGFTAGLEIVDQLTQTYGDQLYPQDKEKLSAYFCRKVYLGDDKNITDQYRLFLYVAVTEGTPRPYALLQVSKLRKSNPEIDAQYAADAGQSEPQFYVKLLTDLSQLVESAKKANASIGNLVGNNQAEIVSFSFVESLERMGLIVARLATESCPGYPPPEAEIASTETDGEEGSDAPATTSTSQQPAALGEITSREQAIELLIRIADFFQRTERHSPVPYSLRQAVKWAKMDLPDLMAELLNGESQPLDELAKRIGFRSSGSDSDESSEES